MAHAIDTLLETLRFEHHPGPPAEPAQIAAVERRLGWVLPMDVKRFYRACNGVKLYRPERSPLAVPPLEDLRFTQDQFLDPGDHVPEGTESWLAIAALHDGNYFSLDLAQLKLPDTVPLILSPHSHYGQPGHALIVAMSFTEFLMDVLKHKAEPYWTHKKFGGYGDALD